MQENEHHHHDETRLIDTGHGKVELSIFEEGQLPHWRLRTLSGQRWASEDISLTTLRENSTISQTFEFVDHGDYLESTSPIPEPHSFNVRLSLGHRGHVHDYDVAFAEHDHDHDHSELDGLDVNSKEYQDAHELAHANDIKRRFDGKEVTNGQILIFGLTGGLIPCPAAITVLLICLQLKALTLGATLVVCFSIGPGIDPRNGWSGCGDQRSSGRQTLEWLQYHRQKSPLYFKRPDCCCWDLHGYTWLEWAGALTPVLMTHTLGTYKVHPKRHR